MTGVTFVPLLSFENLVLSKVPNSTLREHSPYIRPSHKRIDYCITTSKSIHKVSVANIYKNKDRSERL